MLWDLRGWEVVLWIAIATFKGVVKKQMQTCTSDKTACTRHLAELCSLAKIINFIVQCKVYYSKGQIFKHANCWNQVFWMIRELWQFFKAFVQNGDANQLTWMAENFWKDSLGKKTNLESHYAMSCFQWSECGWPRKACYSHAHMGVVVWSQQPC